MATRRFARGLTLAFSLMGSAAGAAPPPAPAATPPAPRITERATVELVLIEVYVSDGHGLPITNLTADNFVLTVDGHGKPIDSVELRQVEHGEAEPPVAEERAPAAQPPNVVTAAPLPRRFILFFDDSTSTPQGMTAARQAAERFLSGGLLADDQVAVASFDRKLRFLHDFTTDRAALVQAVDSTLNDLKRHTDTGADREAYEKAMAEALGRYGDVTSAGEINGIAKSYAQDFTPRVRDVLQALSTLVDVVAPYPGYKAIVFMGEGLPENPAVDFTQQFAGMGAGSISLSDAHQFDLSHEVQILAHEASASGVTLHSIQTPTPAITGSGRVLTPPRRSNTLETLALNTGGTKSTSNDLLKGLNEAERAGRSYYLLGFVPEDPPDGRYHTVQVRLKHATGALRWRRGFTRLLPEQARQRAVEAAYALPELATGMSVDLTAIAGPVSDQERVFDLVLHLPPNAALFVPKPDGAEAVVEAGYVVMAGTDKAVARASREARIAVGRDRLPMTLGVDFYSRIRVPRGALTVTAVVTDRSAGTLGAARLLLPPAGAERGGGLVGLSIYSLEERSLWVEIPPASAGAPPDERPADYVAGASLKSSFHPGEGAACGFRVEGESPTDTFRMEIRRDGTTVRTVTVDAGHGPGTGAPGALAGALGSVLPLEGLAEGDYEVTVRRARDGTDLEDRSLPLRLRNDGGTGSAHGT